METKIDKRLETSFIQRYAADVPERTLRNWRKDTGWRRQVYDVLLEHAAERMAKELREENRK